MSPAELLEVLQKGKYLEAPPPLRELKATAYQNAVPTNISDNIRYKSVSFYVDEDDETRHIVKDNRDTLYKLHDNGIDPKYYIKRYLGNEG